MERKNLYLDNWGRLTVAIGFKIFFKDLTHREIKILNMRFGLEDGIMHTLEETAEEFGVTRERVRQIQAKALDKIRVRLNDYPRSN